MDHKWIVALLAEGVDRNDFEFPTDFGNDVALLAEGVDRNCFGHGTRQTERRRPPRRGRG